MSHDDGRRSRRSPRLPGYDYASPGAYFVTICVHARRCLLGAGAEGGVALTPAGEMAAEWWLRLPGKFPTLALDAFVVMPNHAHGIVVLGAPGRGHAAPSLGRVLQWYKTMTTNAYIRGVCRQHWPPFERRLWQRSYYEHIVRDEAALGRVRAYIAANPARWRLDRFASPA